MGLFSATSQPPAAGIPATTAPAVPTTTGDVATAGTLPGSGEPGGTAPTDTQINQGRVTPVTPPQGGDLLDGIGAFFKMIFDAIMKFIQPLLSAFHLGGSQSSDTTSTVPNTTGQTQAPLQPNLAPSTQFVPAPAPTPAPPPIPAPSIQHVNAGKPAAVAGAAPHTQSAHTPQPAGGSQTTTRTTNVTVGDIRKQEIVDATLIALTDPVKRGAMTDVNFDGRVATFKVGSETRSFSLIDNIDEANSNPRHRSNTGLQATAWREIGGDGKLLNKNVLLEFAGYTGSHGDGSQQTASLEAAAGGKLNPETTEAARFTDRVIKSQGGKDHIENIIYGAHSVGTANALAAHVVSDLEGVKSSTFLAIEPAGATQALKNIQNEMKQPGSDFSQVMQQVTGTSAQTVAAAAEKLNQDLDANSKQSGAVSIREVWQHNGNYQGTLIGQGQTGTGIDTMLAQAQTEVQNRMSGKGSEGWDSIINANSNNGMLGKQMFDNVAAPVLDQGALMTAYFTKSPNLMNLADPNHTILNIRNSAENNAEQVDNQGKALLSAGVVHTDNKTILASAPKTQSSQRQVGS